MILTFVAGILTTCMFGTGAYFVFDLSELYAKPSLEDRLCRDVLRIDSSAEERVTFEAIANSDTRFRVVLFQKNGTEIAWSNGLLTISEVDAIEITFFESLTVGTPRSQFRKSVYHPVADVENVRILMESIH